MLKKEKIKVLVTSAKTRVFSGFGKNKGKALGQGGWVIGKKKNSECMPGEHKQKNRVPPINATTPEIRVREG